MRAHAGHGPKAIIHNTVLPYALCSTRWLRTFSQNGLIPIPMVHSIQACRALKVPSPVKWDRGSEVRELFPSLWVPGIRHAALQLLSRSLTAGVTRHVTDDCQDELQVNLNLIYSRLLDTALRWAAHGSVASEKHLFSDV